MLLVSNRAMYHRTAFTVFVVTVPPKTASHPSLSTEISLSLLLNGVLSPDCMILGSKTTRRRPARLLKFGGTCKAQLQYGLHSPSSPMNGELQTDEEKLDQP